MDAARWEALQKLFHEALDRPFDERVRFVTRASAERKLDPSIRDEAVAMLAAHAGPALSLERRGSDPGSQAAPPELSESIAGYRLRARLGQGGMGEVVLAEHAGATGQGPVAIKLPRRRNAPADWRARFHREQAMHARVGHPNVARLLGVGVTDQGLPYIVMEHVAGKDILTHAAERQLDLEARIRLLRQVCRALAFAHRRRVLHRDIKPANILVDEKGQAKLLDFGIAEKLDEGGHGGEAALTDDRLMTPRYASPEQILGEPLTIASDVFQLGVVLFELITDERPFDGPGDLALSERIVSQDAESPARAFDGSTVPRDLQAIIAKALARDRAERYQSADALAEDLQRFLERRSGDG